MRDRDEAEYVYAFLEREMRYKDNMLTVLERMSRISMDGVMLFATACYSDRYLPKNEGPKNA